VLRKKPLNSKYGNFLLASNRSHHQKGGGGGFVFDADPSLMSLNDEFHQ